ncbi:MAG: hypothetical protein HRT87_02850 [Legionellales bacterium]|nr:hypothetical protein [Legionellales bacterium]
MEIGRRMATHLKDTLSYLGNIKIQRTKNPHVGLRKIRVAIDRNKHYTKITKEILKKQNKNLTPIVAKKIDKEQTLEAISELKQDLQELHQSLELLKSQEQDLLTYTKGEQHNNSKKRNISKKKLNQALKSRKYTKKAI